MPAQAGIQYAAAPRLKHQRLWNTGSPAFAGDDTALFDRRIRSLMPSLRAKRSNPSRRKRSNGLLRRGACHRTRVRATRWLLAMTALRHRARTFPSVGARRDPLPRMSVVARRCGYHPVHRQRDRDRSWPSPGRWSGSPLRHNSIQYFQRQQW